MRKKIIVCGKSSVSLILTFFSEIQAYREKKRCSPVFNHLSMISESVPALGWVGVTPAPAPYVRYRLAG